MRIGFVVEHLGPRGGTEEYIRSVGEGLISRGHRVDLLYEHQTQIHGADWHHFVNQVRAIPAPAESAARRAWLEDYVATEMPDLLYVHNVSFAEDVMAVASERVPVVRYVHDFRPVCLRTSKVFPISRHNCNRALGVGCLLHACSIGPRRGGRLPVSWNHFRSKIADRKASLQMDRILVASRFMRDLLMMNGFSERQITVLPYFCPMVPPSGPPDFVPASRLLFVGQIQRFKGLAVLLEALRFLPAEFSLEVAGDGPWRASCEAQVANWGLGDRVTFHGWADREQLTALMNQIQVVVVPSIWNEPFGIVGLEAMLHAKPVVAFDVGGIREWLLDGWTGVLVKETAAEPLARAIADLCHKPESAKQMGLEGYSRVREHFTAERHIESLLLEFEALTGERAGAVT
jgi:glycosyltransferase involved in cell wall biosynthesis